MIFPWFRRRREDTGPWVDVIDLEPRPEPGDGNRTELGGTFAIGDPRRLEDAMGIPEGALERMRELWPARLVAEIGAAFERHEADREAELQRFLEDGFTADAAADIADAWALAWARGRRVTITGRELGEDPNSR
jgi:hypothetical protein